MYVSESDDRTRILEHLVSREEIDFNERLKIVHNFVFVNVSFSCWKLLNDDKKHVFVRITWAATFCTLKTAMNDLWSGKGDVSNIPRPDLLPFKKQVLLMEHGCV